MHTSPWPSEVLARHLARRWRGGGIFVNSGTFIKGHISVLGAFSGVGPFILRIWKSGFFFGSIGLLHTAIFPISPTFFVRIFETSNLMGGTFLKH